MVLVLPWPMWEDALPREFPYGTWGFVALLIVSIIYLLTMWLIGFLFLRTYRLFPQKKEYKYFGTGILIVAFFDTIHALGEIMFFITNDSRVPIFLDTNVVFYFYPTVTSLCVMGIFTFYMLVYTYGVYKLEEKKPSDNVFYALGFLGIALGLNPYNFWHMIKPEGAFDTKPITGILLLIVGILAVYKFYTTLKTKLSLELEKAPGGVKRIKIVTWGLILMLILVFLMMPHGMLATLAGKGVEWAKVAMIAITCIKLISLASSAILIYSGFVWPSWAERIFGK